MLCWLAVQLSKPGLNAVLYILCSKLASLSTRDVPDSASTSSIKQQLQLAPVHQLAMENSCLAMQVAY